MQKLTSGKALQKNWYREVFSTLFRLASHSSIGVGVSGIGNVVNITIFVILAGIVANTLCIFLDYARTRLASDVAPGGPRYSGLFHCVFSTLYYHGISGFICAWPAAFVGAFIYRAAQLALFKQIQELNPYQKDKGFKGAFSSFIVVTIARTLVMPFNYPFDTLYRLLLLQADVPFPERLYYSPISCAQYMIANHGFQSLYNGLLPEVLRGIGGSLVIVAYDVLKTRLLG